MLTYADVCGRMCDVTKQEVLDEATKRDMRRDMHCHNQNQEQFHFREVGYARWDSREDETVESRHQHRHSEQLRPWDGCQACPSLDLSLSPPGMPYPLMYASLSYSCLRL